MGGNLKTAGPGPDYVTGRTFHKLGPDTKKYINLCPSELFQISFHSFKEGIAQFPA